MRTLCCLLLVVSPLHSDDWPQWRGPQRDGVSREVGIRFDWPEDGPKILWERPTGDGYSCIAIARGRAFTMVQQGPDEAVVCWNAETGAELWRYRYPARFTNRYGNGPRSTPTLDGDVLYTVGATGWLHCLRFDPKTSAGEVVWKKDLLEEFSAKNLEWGVSFSPLVLGELLIIQPGGTKGNSVAALDKRTGAIRWQSLDDPQTFSSPMPATIGGQPQVLFFTEKGLVGVARDSGQFLWRFPWLMEDGCNIATPIVRDDRVFISTGYKKGAALVKIDKAADGWEAKSVYQNKKMCNQFGSSVRIGEHLYGFHETTLQCLEWSTGKILWKQRDFERGTVVGIDGHLIILGEHGLLATAEASPKAYREKARATFSQDKCWTMPVVANGRLYVRDQKRLVCYDVRN